MNISRLSAILADSDKLKTQKGYDTIIKRTVALLVDNGVRYQENNGLLVINYGEKQFYVSRNYAESYLGHQVSEGTIALQPVQSGTVPDIMAADKIISEIYRTKIVQDNLIQNSLKKKKIQEKTHQEQIDSLKKQNSYLQGENTKLQARVTKLEAENESLSARLLAEQEKVKYLLDEDALFDEENEEYYISNEDESDVYQQGYINIDETTSENTEESDYDDDDNLYNEDDYPVNENDSNSDSDENSNQNESISEEYKTKEVSEEYEAEDDDDSTMEKETSENTESSHETEDVPGFDVDNGFEDYEEEKTNLFAFPYQDDIYELSRSEFILDSATLSREINGKLYRMRILTSPLSTKETYPQIMTLVIKGAKTETYIIPAGEGLTFEFLDEIFEVSGMVENGDYIMSLLPLSDDSQTEIQMKSNGVKGHLYLPLSGSDKKVHISPVNFKNSKDDGFANFFYAVEDGDGNVVAYGDNNEPGDTIVNIDGRNIKIIAKWKENSMAGLLMQV